jgi:methylglyoxal synthase
MQPHDVDIKALLRISSIENIVVATTKSTADFVISSPLFSRHYQPVKTDYDSYVRRLGG